MLDVVEKALPYSQVETIVTAHQLSRQRRRKLSAEMGLLLVVAMNLWAQQSLSRVLIKLIKGFRFIWPDAMVLPASKGAISQVRYEIGAQPVADLFHGVCTVMTTPHTPGAFVCGLRLMALDSTIEEVADTPANAQVFRFQFSAGIPRKSLIETDGGPIRVPPPTRPNHGITPSRITPQNQYGVRTHGPITVLLAPH